MAARNITFRWLTGVKKDIFRNASLVGSWDSAGVYQDNWNSFPMTAYTGNDGCPAFKVILPVREGQQNLFKWGVRLDGPGGNDLWGIVTEINDAQSADRWLSFSLSDGLDSYDHHFIYSRFLGANKLYEDPSGEAQLQFGVWAPSASSVEVVFGAAASGYIADDGTGIDAAMGSFPLDKAGNGIWLSGSIGPFSTYFGLPYMYRIKNEDGAIVYRTDIFSRSQIGYGDVDPAVHPADWDGTPATLNGSKSCSVVIDPDIVREEFTRPENGEPTYISADDFWANEFDLNKPLPTRVDDLVIYELHIGALGFGSPKPGTLADAIALLDYLQDLGINAIELLPMADFSGTVGWGYGDTHHQVIQTAAGGRDQYRHFIRECHRRGIAVIQDVVYNHYDSDAGRAQWQYDSTRHEHNCYYWYQGRPGDYPIPEGGYLDNGSSGWAPNYREVVVRQQFISAAVFLIEEMHVDGLRVDLTQAIHRDNQIHANGFGCSDANLFGQKLLREWSRTLKMIRPAVMLIAEDHTGWDGVTKLPADGGLGFDATWFVDFYHSAAGASDSSGGFARLLKNAGYGGDGPLSMDAFAGRLWDSQYRKVVYHASHDEAGNAKGSARTMVVAVNYAPIWGDTRKYAEMRSRVAFGLSVLSASTPMFLMGEEIGAQKPYTYNAFLQNREDLISERAGNGAAMYRYYQDIIHLSRQFYAVRSHNIDILHVNNDARVIVFKRYMDNEQLLVLASFNEKPFSSYTIYSDNYRLPDGNWKEIFNSDASVYGGSNFGNGGAAIAAAGGTIAAAIPANGFIVLVKM